MEKLLKLLADIRPDVDFAAESALVTDGILDSFDIVAVVSEINDAYGVSIGVTDLLPENFDSARAIYALIQERLK
ncbi:MAG: acyl carrier protein [Oscillospiraceae bacterium]|nr:acyl carrier protein [Oscillospiraceae bacterium]